MSGGGGNFVSNLGGVASSAMTGGLLNTKGNGLLQGGSLKDAFGTATGGLAGMIGGPDVNVPGSQARPEFTLSENGRLAKDLTLGNYMPTSATQSQGTLDSLNKFANTQGPSQSAQYQLQGNQRATNNALDNVESQGKSAMASANTNMAMRGGLDAGSRERMNRSNMLGMMSGKQQALNEGHGRELDILANDEQQKLGVLQSLSPQLLNQAQFEAGLKQYDIGNNLNVMGNKYSEDMRAWAGNQSAREQAELANKKQGILGLGIMGL